MAMSNGAKIELNEMQGWYDQYLLARDAVTKWEEVKKTCRDRLVEYLEQSDAEQGAVNGVPVCKRSVVKSRRFATAKFRSAYPDLAEEFTSDSETTRFDILGE